MDRKTVSQCISADYCRGWNDAVSEMEESGGWISVEDGLPEESDLVLAIASGKPRPNITFHDAYVFASYSAAEGWIVEEYPDWEDAEITHWWPLPEPPRGDKL